MYYKVKTILAQYIYEFSQKNNHDKTLDINIIHDIPLEYPKDKKHGHLATPVCFVLAKQLKRSPKDIAEDIALFLKEKAQLKLSNRDSKQDLIDKNSLQVFEEITALNGYLNLKLSFAFFEHETHLNLTSPSDFAKDSKKNHRILLEYVSANPTGPLHIGHARGAIFGSALQRIGIHLGYDIVGEYYVNDAGSQIEMLALSVFNACAKILNLPLQDGEVYKGEYIDKVAQDVISHFGKEYLCQGFDSISLDLGTYTKNKMLQQIQFNLQSANITFQSFVSERELYSKWQDTLTLLKNNHALTKKDGAIWLKSSLKQDEKDRVLIRENGEPTYMAGDIIYHRDKFERDYDSYINIWGADHHGYIARIKASIEFLGYDSNKLEVLLAQMVNLLKAGQPYKMSKRAGNFILMQDVINDIGADSLKFIFLSKSLDTHLEFDVDDLSKQDSSNPVFYINYANARIHTLLEKSAFNKEEIMSASLQDIITLTTNPFQSSQDTDVATCDNLLEELANLILSALSFSYILRQSYEERALQKICEYLKNLAKQFHAFYNSHRILQTPFEAQILKSLMLVSLSFSTGFSLLGIEIKTKM